PRRRSLVDEGYRGRGGPWRIGFELRRRSGSLFNGELRFERCLAAHGRSLLGTLGLQLKLELRPAVAGGILLDPLNRPQVETLLLRGCPWRPGLLVRVG